MLFNLLNSFKFDAQRIYSLHSFTLSIHYGQAQSAGHLFWPSVILTFRQLGQNSRGSGSSVSIERHYMEANIKALYPQHRATRRFILILR
jgi:hypothetical protein